MKLLFAAGGTGGHVFPALAVAKAARELKRDTEVLFIGTVKGFESKLVPQAGYALELIDVAGLKGKGIFQKLKGIVLLPKAFWQSWKILRKFCPTAVFGIGGYASGPILLLAAVGSAKTAILEPNTTPGISNRLLARVVDRVFVAFEEAIHRLPRKKCVFSGNPIREDILAVPPPTFSEKRKTVLIFGGSQGAKRLNDAMVEALASLISIRSSLQFIHQTGEKDFEKVRTAYLEAGFIADVRPFIHEMAEAYRESDFIVARSGSSVLEIAACGRPSILVPFPYAADNHQETNARVLEKAGAALFVRDEDLNGATLSASILSLTKDIEKLKAMSEQALTLRKEDAAVAIARDLLEKAA